MGNSRPIISQACSRIFCVCRTSSTAFRFIGEIAKEVSVAGLLQNHRRSAAQDALQLVLFARITVKGKYACPKLCTNN